MEEEDKSSGAARALKLTNRSGIHRNVMAMETMTTLCSSND
uniref:Uncharacterized protein n=1 Tax=Oryza sativa subsp. japonica TaxID=39947 RepID=Q53L66_ORYSJ|nr:hypothetical protein LOC_Os11g15160 [Oryza sativa Japonica Group]